MLQCSDIESPLRSFYKVTILLQGLVYSPERIADNPRLEVWYQQQGAAAPQLDPCIDPWEEWGCGPDLLENVTAGCKGKALRARMPH